MWRLRPVHLCRYPRSFLGQLGSSAVRQARVLAAAVSGDPDTYPATYNTAITKLGPIQAGSAGVTVAQAERAGLPFCHTDLRVPRCPNTIPVARPSSSSLCTAMAAASSVAKWWGVLVFCAG